MKSLEMSKSRNVKEGVKPVPGSVQHPTKADFTHVLDSGHFPDLFLHFSVKPTKKLTQGENKTIFLSVFIYFLDFKLTCNNKTI